jgi:hypothetical protein
LKPKPCDAGLRLAVSILCGFPPEVRFLRSRPNVNIDRVGRHMRVQPSVRAARNGALRRAGPWPQRPQPAWARQSFFQRRTSPTPNPLRSGTMRINRKSSVCRHIRRHPAIVRSPIPPSWRIVI